MIRHVSFDFDGVLAQGSNEAYIDCLHRALQSLGIELDPGLERQRILATWGLPVRELASELLKEHPDKVDLAINSFNEARRSPAFLAQVSLFNGVEATLKQLTTRYSLSIVSGAERPLVLSVLGPQLATLFASIHTSSDYEPSLQKPSPHMLKQAMLQASVTPNETVYIGDAPNDLRMAVAAGVEPIAILTGHLTRSVATELGARHILEDITEFPEVLASL